MIEIGAFEAKTHLSEIPKQVSHDEEFCVTNGGKMVAAITPPEAYRKLMAQKSFARLRDLRKNHPLGTAEKIIRWKKKVKNDCDRLLYSGFWLFT